MTFSPFVNSLRAAFLGAVLAVAVGCGVPESSRPQAVAPGNADESAGGGENALLENAAQARPRRPPDLQPAWPSDWRVLDSGQAGGEASPAFTWFRLAAGAVPPEEAAQRALGALRPLAGPLSTSDFATSKSRAEVVGQFQGARLSGVIRAAAEKSGTEVRVTVEAAR